VSLFGLFDIGKSALFTSQTALDVTSHNIANVNTSGFSRQEAILEIANPVHSRSGFMGRGVTVSSIERHFDRFLEAQILGQKQNLGRATILENGFSRLEELFNEQSGSGLSTALTEFFHAWQEVSTNPQSLAQRTVLIQNANNLVSASQVIEERAMSIITSAEEDIKVMIDKMNDLALNISLLNEKIAQIEGGSTREANDLRDSRNRLLSELSEIVNIQTYEDSSGRLTVIVGQRNLVSGSVVHSVTESTTSDGQISILLENTDITKRITNGNLYGLLSLKDTIKDGALKDVRKLIASLIKETNRIHRNGYGLDGFNERDFFSPLQLTTRDYSNGANITSATIPDPGALTLHQYEIQFTDSDTYDVVDLDTGNPVITGGAYNSGDTISFGGIDIVIENDGAGTPQANDKFFVSPLESAINNFGVAVTRAEEIGAAKTSAGLPGDNENALEIIDLYDGSIADLGDASYHAFYSTIVTNTGALSRASKDSLTFEEKLFSEMQLRRETISGVNLDEEAINLIKFQKAYEAGASLIRVTEELLDTLLSL